jgi:hypothetical protein
MLTESARCLDIVYLKRGVGVGALRLNQHRSISFVIFLFYDRAFGAGIKIFFEV